VLRHRGKLWKFRGVATVDGEVVCEGDLMAVLVPKEQS